MANISYDCPHCGTKKAGFTSFAEHRLTGKEGTYLVPFVCSVCEGGIFIVYIGVGNPSPHSYKTNPETNSYAASDRYPAAAILQAPAHTPENIARFYVQGAENLKQRNWDAAGSMCRKAVDVSTKALSAEDDKGKVLYQRIERLASRGIITEDLRAWAQEIRDLGNDAVHEEEPFSEEDARELLSFTELYLTYVYTLPQTLAARKATKGKDT